MSRGTPLNRNAATARRTAPNPMVTMIIPITGRPMRWRSTSRLNPAATANIPAPPNARARTRARPSAWTPAATSPDANITNSPSAKFMTRVAL